MSILKISLNSITLSVYVSGAEGVKWMLNMHLQVLTQLGISLFCFVSNSYCHLIHENPIILQIVTQTHLVLLFGENETISYSRFHLLIPFLLYCMRLKRIITIV